MKKSLQLTVWLAFIALVASDRSFVDSKGDVFRVSDNAKPRIVINAFGAVSFFHLGEFLQLLELKHI